MFGKYQILIAPRTPTKGKQNLLIEFQTSMLSKTKIWIASKH